MSRFGSQGETGQPGAGPEGERGGTSSDAVRAAAYARYLAAPPPALAGCGPAGHGTIRLRSAGGEAPEGQPAAAAGPPAVAGPAAAGTPAVGGAGHGTIRLRQPGEQPAPAGAEPEAAAEPEPAPAAPSAPAPAAGSADDLHPAFLAAAARVMTARSAAGSPDGDAKLTEAIEARDAAKAAWEAANG